MKKTPTRRAKAAPSPHIVIEGVTPSIDGGRHPAKRVVGRPCAIEATIYRDGHAKIRAVAAWRRKGDAAAVEVPMTCVNSGLDLWRAEIPLERPGKILFAIEAWTDEYASWLADLKKRVDAGQQVASEALEGAALIDAVAKTVKGAERRALDEAAARLRSSAAAPAAVWQAASDAALLELLDRRQPRADAVRTPIEYPIAVDRDRGLVGAWYEMFPRSQGTVPGKASTLREAERRLPDIRAMGFDVLYLPPVHPIGTTNRKGRNNSLTAGPDDPGSPWGIGSPAGGHDAVEPALGTIDDWDHFVDACREHGLEIALDMAIQCSPDHPWVKSHPEWFYRRPDGTIKYAENPPKKYEDIYPVNFDTTDRDGLWKEMRRIFRFWIDHGVRIFRVDNPHTKPLAFWEWLIDDLTADHPDVLFLAEAFTRPPLMKGLAKRGFSQSYSYFTWRNTKAELEEYLTELTTTEMKEYFRPNFFANTPDILPPILVEGGRPAFMIRLILAATLSPSYGIYSGFELCESDSMPHHALPGDVEYKDSEKYEIKVRDWNAPGNIKDLVAQVNQIRRENPALREFANIRFLPADSDQILFFVKRTPDLSNVLLIAVNLDPHGPHHCTVEIPPSAIGVEPGGSYEVQDLLTGARYTWAARNHVRLDPATLPAHILRVERTAP